MAVLYRHTRLDNNTVFYIGIGKEDKRAFSKKDRNKYWKNITNKCGYEIEILKKDLSWEDACELEQALISWYGRKDLGLGELVNMTDGGDGILGFKITEETRVKLKNRGFSKEHREKLSITSTGRLHSQETKDYLSLVNTGKIHSDETKEKIRQNSATARIVLDTQTGVFYNSAKEAAKILGHNISTLQGRLNGNKVNNTSLIYV